MGYRIIRGQPHHGTENKAQLDERREWRDLVHAVAGGLVSIGIIVVVVYKPRWGSAQALKSLGKSLIDDNHHDYYNYRDYYHHLHYSHYPRSERDGGTGSAHEARYTRGVDYMNREP